MKKLHERVGDAAWGRTSWRSRRRCGDRPFTCERDAQAYRRGRRRAHIDERMHGNTVTITPTPPDPHLSAAAHLTARGARVKNLKVWGPGTDGCDRSKKACSFENAISL